MFLLPLCCSDKDKERSKDKKKSDKHRSSSKKEETTSNHDNEVMEPEGAGKSEPMEEGECYDQDTPMNQDY